MTDNNNNLDVVHGERNITLQAEHLPGQLNSQADEESRKVRDRCDWMLNQSVFQQKEAAMGLLVCLHHT